MSSNSAMVTTSRLNVQGSRAFVPGLTHSIASVFPRGIHRAETFAVKAIVPPPRASA